MQAQACCCPHKAATLHICSPLSQMLRGFPCAFITLLKDDMMPWSFVIFQHYSTAQQFMSMQFMSMHGLHCMQLWMTYWVSISNVCIVCLHNWTSKPVPKQWVDSVDNQLLEAATCKGRAASLKRVFTCSMLWYPKHWGPTCLHRCTMHSHSVLQLLHYDQATSEPLPDACRAEVWHVQRCWSQNLPGPARQQGQ